MVKKILLGVGAALLLLIVGFSIYVAMQPNEFSVVRSGTIDAPPEAVFPYVNNLQKMNEWSPWMKLDPNIKTDFEGPEEGEGAKFHWDGDERVGEGIMTITDSQPDEQVQMNLQFIKPMEAENTTVFTLKPDGERTIVTWTMSGKNNFMGKAFCMLMNMDKMIGDQFEQGLANMKSLVEASSKTQPAEAVTKS